MACDHRWNPAARRRHRDHPTRRVCRFDRCGPAAKRLIERGERGGVIAPFGGRYRARGPSPEQRQKWVGAALERIRIAWVDVRIVAIGIDRLRALATVRL